ncbi:hypothetical protein AC629_14770 [Bradyrhizobium sp. NAS80.1]|uniref:hypothetical protein n=1 Tax=Bradyrhizobium sp. NAS80.1 TaxID=1680159 RepID=UPI0009612B1E|nr:hypothetical protein [Bradyrhizobium sp. NAS80.1]OKO87206.1 hypothetical protein AC629_14770 [Bradyrhizobium sp. NAS80.1]
MLEIGIFCVILLAAGYWAAMYVMGRHDVIHGKFVHSEDEGAFAPSVMPTPPPPFPKRPFKAAQTDSVPPANDAVATPVNSEALQSLLAAIQQDLKSVA